VAPNLAPLNPAPAPYANPAPAPYYPPQQQDVGPLPPRNSYRVADGYELNIRASGSANASVIRVIPYYGNGIRLIGSCYGGWCPIEYQGTQGWAKGNFLIRE
jgi:uncharacterized protein YraI